MNNPHSLTLLQARDALQAGTTGPVEIVEASLARIARTEPDIHACLTICADEALDRAKALQKAGPDPAAPLWGVPLTVKDILCTKGIRTTAASRMLENYIPPYDAHVVRRLKEAGAVIVAKTNMDEFAMGSSTEFSAFMHTANPWNTGCVPGGSSGGSAASVAAMQAYGSLGSDTGGSVRQPAAFCGCVGIKPTYGRVSRYGAIAYGSSFDQVGPLARTVKDSALLLAAIAGYDERDATSAALPVADYAKAAERADLKGMTLGLPLEYWQDGLSSEVKNACLAAVATARALGAEVIDLSLPSLAYSVAAYYILASAEASSNLARYDGMRYGKRAEGDLDLVETYIASRSQAFGEEVQRRILLGTYTLSSGYYDAYYTKAAKVRRLILEDFETALSRCDALLAPACPVTAWKFGSYTDDPLTAYKMDILTLSLNLAGLPGICLPAGLGAESGLPVGLQILGKAFGEATIIGIAAALEGALPVMGPPTGLGL